MRHACRIISICLALAWPTCLSAEEEPDIESQFLRDARQLTFEGRRAGEGYYSADGRRLMADRPPLRSVSSPWFNTDRGEPAARVTDTRGQA